MRGISGRTGVQDANLEFSEAWLFGSFANEKQHENSDIDIVIVLKYDALHTFDTEVQLMVIRKGDETLIEPHAFTKEEFDKNVPIVNQIMRYGVKIIF